MFWDRDDDGQIWPQDTFMGFYELGFNLFFCALATLIINLNFSYPTRLAYSYFPDPFFRVYVPSIHKAKHGSDSGTYDKEGRFIPQAFEDLFSKFDRGNKAALSAGELWNIMSANRVAVDPFGWFASVFEFGVTFLLVQKDGKVDKEDLRRIYDVSSSSPDLDSLAKCDTNKGSSRVPYSGRSETPIARTRDGTRASASASSSTSAGKSWLRTGADSRCWTAL